MQSWYESFESRTIKERERKRKTKGKFFFFFFFDKQTNTQGGGKVILTERHTITPLKNHGKTKGKIKQYIEIY